MISMMVAIGKNRVIGRNNKLPWHLPADLAYFKKTTTGHTVIMGRKTFESIGKPLPNRRNVVITRNKDYKAEECIVCHTIEEAQRLCSNEEAFVIGGADIFSEFLPFADRLYITFIEEAFEGDIFFPEIDYSDWVLVSKVLGERNERNPYSYYFAVYDRV